MCRNAGCIVYGRTRKRRKEKSYNLVGVLKKIDPRKCKIGDAFIITRFEFRWQRMSRKDARSSLVENDFINLVIILYKILGDLLNLKSRQYLWQRIYKI